MPYLGEITSLLAAMCWTVSSTAFAVASRAASPLAANQFRLYASLPLLVVLAVALLGAPWPAGASWAQLASASASGLCGLVLGDIGYFYALAKIGPRLCSVIMVSWPACVVLIEAGMGRAPSVAVLGGIALTMAGVVLVLLRGRDDAQWDPRVTPRQRTLGVLGAVLGSVGQAAGFVLAGPAMAADGDVAAIEPLHCTVVRMATAVVVMQGVAFAQGQGFATAHRPLHPPEAGPFDEVAAEADAALAAEGQGLGQTRLLGKGGTPAHQLAMDPGPGGVPGGQRPRRFWNPGRQGPLQPDL